MTQLQDKVAIITGAAGGIGLAAENDEIAAPMAFLASDDASNLTGAPFRRRRWLHGTMRPLRFVSLATCLLLAGVQCDRATPDDTWIQQARSLADEFQAKLKGKLLTAMKEGGPTQAIQVCNVEAPRIESQITEGKVAGWTVSRTALRVRNPKNRPTDWQKEALAELERRIAAGEPLAQVAWQGRRGDQFVYMRPIMMDGACMTCHGPVESIPTPVATEIERLYPQDQATGFSLGDMRGAFVVTGPPTRR